MAGTATALADYQAMRDDLSVEFFDVTDEIASFRWDLPQVKQEHLRMSKEMNREAELLLSLDARQVRRIA